MKLLKLTLFAGLINLLHPLVGLELSPSTQSTIDSHFKTVIKQGHYSGIVALTAIEGQEVYFDSFGYQSLKTKEPMEKDTIFRIYSMTKPIVSVALMQLVERGKLSLKTPIIDIIPEFKDLKVLREDGSEETLNKAITLQHLLTHTAGFSYGWSDPPVDQKYKAVDLWGIKTSQDFINAVAKLPLIQQPGEKWHYSIAVDIQGVIIERITGRSLSKHLNKVFFTPLKMRDTDFFIRQRDNDRLASNYRIENGRLKETGTKYFNYLSEEGFHSGGGGLLSTIEDYYQFAQMLLSKGTYKGVEYITEETFNLMTRDHLSEVLDDPSDPWSPHSFGLEEDRFGLGFRIKTITDPKTQEIRSEQYSWNGAAGTEFWVDPMNQVINIICIQKMNSGYKLGEFMQALLYKY